MIYYNKYSILTLKLMIMYDSYMIIKIKKYFSL